MTGCLCSPLTLSTLIYVCTRRSELEFHVVAPVCLFSPFAIQCNRIQVIIGCLCSPLTRNTPIYARTRRSELEFHVFAPACLCSSPPLHETERFMCARAQIPRLCSSLSLLLPPLTRSRSIYVRTGVFAPACLCFPPYTKQIDLCAHGHKFHVFAPACLFSPSATQRNGIQVIHPISRLSLHPLKCNGIEVI